MLEIYGQVYLLHNKCMYVGIKSSKGLGKSRIPILFLHKKCKGHDTEVYCSQLQDCFCKIRVSRNQICQEWTSTSFILIGEQNCGVIERVFCSGHVFIIM